MDRELKVFRTNIIPEEMLTVEVVNIDNSQHDISMLERDIAKAARMSFIAEDDDFAAIDEKTPKDDARLIRRLASDGHTSPFEHLFFSFQIRNVDLPTAVQMLRHRTLSFNMTSRRYTSKGISFHVPQFREQAKKNKQGSGGPLHAEDNSRWQKKLSSLNKDAMKLYNEMIEAGVSREQARYALPQCMHTNMGVSGNLLNWIRFLRLRNTAEAQEEVSVVAKMIKSELEYCCPFTIAMLDSGNFKL